MPPRQARLGDADEATPLYTIGHSTRSLDALLALLTEHEVAHLFDIRRWPASKRNPQFNEGNLREGLTAQGISYTHLEAMGGYRDPVEASEHTAWETKGFQGYADHMGTEDWQAAFERVLARADELDQAGRGHACVMCAEIVPHRCHRRLVSDAAVARGRRVVHVIDEGNVREHELPSFARVRGQRVVYPGD